MVLDFGLGEDRKDSHPVLVRKGKQTWVGLKPERARRDKTVCRRQTIKKGKQLSSESNLGASAGGTRLGAAETDSARYARIVSNRFFAFRTKEVAQRSSS